MSLRDPFDFLQIFGLGKHKDNGVDYLFRIYTLLKLHLHRLQGLIMLTF